MKDAITIGVDLGDKNHIAVVYDSQGNELQVARVQRQLQRSHRTQPG